MAAIYWVRHGQTDGGKFGLVTPADADLNETGMFQGTRLGKHFANIKFTKAFCSNLPRAQQTADLVMKESTNPIDVTVDARIQELCFKKYDGQNFAEAIINGAKVRGALSVPEDYPYRKYVFDGAEPVEEVIKRLSAFFDGLLMSLDQSNDDPENILIVSHGLATKIFLRFLQVSAEKAEFEMKGWTNEILEIPFKNTSFHKFTVGTSSVSEAGARVIQFNKVHCCDHLKLPKPIQPNIVSI